MRALIDLFLHLDTHLTQFVATYGAWVYALLFAIVFAETGLVVTPFLPGDSLLFAAGALAAAGGLNVWMVIALLAVAAVLGDAVNYAAGRAIGPRIFNATDRSSWWHRLLNREHLEQTWLQSTVVVDEDHDIALCRVDPRVALQSHARTARHIAHIHVGVPTGHLTHDMLGCALRVTVYNNHLAISWERSCCALQRFP